MKHFSKLLFLISVILIIVSCSSGSKSLKRGDYYQATIDAVEKLRMSPKSEKAQLVLQKAYPLAEQNALREIENAKLRNDVSNYETIVYQYERLNKMAADIYASPRANELIQRPTEYHAQLSEARNMAADQYYNLGNKALNIGTIDQSRLALKFFQQANSFSYGYKDVLNMMEEAKFQSTLRIAFEKPRTSPNYQLSADFFSDNLIADISKRFENKLIRFYNFDEYSNNSKISPHQYLVLNFEDFSVGNVYDTKNTIEVKSDSVKVGTATIQGKKVDVYNTVTAKFNTYRREIKSRGILSVKIFDNQDKLIQQRNFTGEYVWFTTWANFNGDERALSQAQKQASNQTPQIPPPHQALFIEFTKPIYTQAYNYIYSFYNRY